jgi:high-affinity iron transporter
MRKVLAVAVAAVALAAALCSTALAAETEYETWGDIAQAMEAVLDEAHALYVAGDPAAAKDKVNDAYYGYYEKLGFERQVKSRVSGSRASTVELQFSFTKSAINAGDPQEDVRELLDGLIAYLHEDAAALDGRKTGDGDAGGADGGGGGAVVLVESLLIITREGFEAILIVGAIIAYLVKSGNGDKVKAVYKGSVIALAASVAMAFVLNMLSGANGANQEIIEGVTMLIAVVVLFYVSTWMVSKAESAAWTSYIEGKVQSSVTSGSVFSLAFAAFLAVFREGAETILFYKALLADTDVHIEMVWVGLAIGVVALVVIYLLIRFMSIRLPLKPFFLGTSALMFIMSITFVGSGIKELQEGDLLGATMVRGVPTVDILGVYPTAETLIAQAVLIAATVATVAIQLVRSKRAREARGD